MCQNNDGIIQAAVGIIVKNREYPYKDCDCIVVIKPPKHLNIAGYAKGSIKLKINVMPAAFPKQSV